MFIIFFNITVRGTCIYHWALEVKSSPPILFTRTGLYCKMPVKGSTLYMPSQKLCYVL